MLRKWIGYVLLWFIEPASEEKSRPAWERYEAIKRWTDGWGRQGSRSGSDA